MEAVWISLAFTAGLLTRQIGLPPLVGFLLAGFILNRFGLQTGPVLEHIAHLGVLLLLFSIGLKLKPKSLLRSEVWAGASLHLVLSVLIATGIILLLGFALPRQAALLSLVLAFSSTVVAAKVLEQKKELRAFHGRVTLGILIMQDILAVACISLFSGTHPSWLALLTFLLPWARPILHKLLDWSGHEELQLLFGLLAAIVVGGLGFSAVGLSSELGALVIGVLLSNHKRAVELSHSLWGLKELFLVGFFLQIGLTGTPSWQHFEQALILCLLLPFKAVLFFILLLLFRLRARTAFLASLLLANYSEFALILLALLNHLQLIPADWLLIGALAVGISFVVSAPLNKVSHELYDRLAQWLQPMESNQRHSDDEPLHLGTAKILIFGMGRIGTGAYHYLHCHHFRVLGMDSDPHKVEEHRHNGLNVLYADAEDSDLWHNLDFHGVDAVLLAMPDANANIFAAEHLRRRGFAGIINATSLYPEEEARILAAGADSIFNFYQQAGWSFAEQLTRDLQA